MSQAYVQQAQDLALLLLLTKMAEAKRLEEQLRQAYGFLAFLEDKQIFPTEKPQLQQMFQEYRALMDNKLSISLNQAIFLLTQEGHCRVVPPVLAGAPTLEWRLAEPNEQGEEEEEDDQYHHVQVNQDNQSNNNNNEQQKQGTENQSDKKDEKEEEDDEPPELEEPEDTKPAPVTEKKEEEEGIRGEPVQVFYCNNCELRFSTGHELAQHKVEERNAWEAKQQQQNGDSAAKKKKNKKKKKKKNKGKKKKHRILITDPIVFQPMEVGGEQTVTIFVRNAGTSHQKLMTVCPYNPVPEFTLDDKLGVCEGKTKALLRGSTEYEIKLTCRPKFIGKLQCVLCFDFGHFRIVRYVDVVVKDGRQFRELDPVPKSKPKPVPQKKFRKIIPGEKPALTEQDLPFKKQLEDYLPPSWLEETKKPSELKAKLAEKLRTLNEKTYIEHFSLLLWLEEKQMSNDIHTYDMFKVGIDEDSGSQNRAWLEIPGLAENRPAVVFADKLYLMPSTETSGEEKKEEKKDESELDPKWEGYVHQIDKERVLLGFHQEFLSHHTSGKEYDIQLALDRTTSRRKLQAVFLSSKLPQTLLFPPSNPTLVKALIHVDDNKFKLYDRTLNKQQVRAVKSIVEGQAGPIPYLILGPPGTGKTVTLVETIKQIRTMLSNSFVLACAPSNTAADLLIERLKKNIDKKEMIRINNFQRPKQDVGSDILEYCSYDVVRGLFTIPDLKKLSGYRVVVCTCLSAAMLVNIGIEPGHFTHILIDEAGQADEPETLAALSGLVGNETRVAMAADPKQLGPSVRSPHGLEYRLNLSMFERLCDLPLYSRNEEKKGSNKTTLFAEYGYYNPQFITKLVHNYRSHPAILYLPSQLFYDNELIASADETMRSSFCKWDELPNKNEFPIIFHGVLGIDIQEGNSPSWFNPTEAILVYNYIEKLQKFKSSGFDLSQVGVISPFRKQVEKIRTLLKGRSMANVKVGSVEDFQGQERRVIIVSLVRSNTQYVANDLKHHLGFLKHPKRFNVAITRAQCLVIVIGNPFVIMEDEEWGEWLKFCMHNHSYVGVDPPKLEGLQNYKEEQELWKQKGAMDQEEEEENYDEDDENTQQQLQEYPEWKYD